MPDDGMLMVIKSNHAGYDGQNLGHRHQRYAWIRSEYKVCV